jgi:YgiT-type zinc finger domain-containing protein
MKCSQCGSQSLESSVGDHSYDEAGLPHVVLRGVETRRCGSCGEASVVLPSVTKLHLALGFEISQQLRFLLGPEVRFLRKVLDLSEAEMCGILGSDMTLSRLTEWEANGVNPANDRDENVAADRLMRLYFQHKFAPSQRWPEYFKQITDSLQVRTTIEARYEAGAWTTCTVPLS